MSVRTVAGKDLRSVRRSWALWTATTLLILGVVVFTYFQEGYSRTPTETVLSLFESLAMGLRIVLPILALVASYLAIAGERRSGGIKFLLGVPNTRRDVFLGKLSSRLVLVVAGLGLAFAAVTSVAVARHAVLPIAPVAGLFVVSVLYATVFVSVAVALSGAVAARGRAIAAAVGSYFVLVLLFVIPVFRIPSLVRWFHQRLLGLEPAPNLYDAVSYVSPYVAFQKATNLVFPASQRTEVFGRAPGAGSDLPVYLADEVSLLVFAVWIVVPLALGYLRFDRIDID